jgi:hypothetical protein
MRCVEVGRGRQCDLQDSRQDGRRTTLVAQSQKYLARGLESARRFPLQRSRILGLGCYELLVTSGILNRGSCVEHVVQHQHTSCLSHGWHKLKTEKPWSNER